MKFFGFISSRKIAKVQFKSFSLTSDSVTSPRQILRRILVGILVGLLVELLVAFLIGFLVAILVDSGRHGRYASRADPDHRSSHIGRYCQVHHAFSCHREASLFSSFTIVMLLVLTVIIAVGVRWVFVFD